MPLFFPVLYVTRATEARFKSYRSKPAGYCEAAGLLESFEPQGRTCVCGSSSRLCWPNAKRASWNRVNKPKSAPENGTFARLAAPTWLHLATFVKEEEKVISIGQNTQESLRKPPISAAGQDTHSISPPHPPPPRRSTQLHNACLCALSCCSPFCRTAEAVGPPPSQPLWPFFSSLLLPSTPASKASWFPPSLGDFLELQLGGSQPHTQSSSPASTELRGRRRRGRSFRAVICITRSSGPIRGGL